MNYLELSKVSKKGLTSIPARVRKAAKIEEGDFLSWEVDEKTKTIIVKVIKNPYKFLRGKYCDPNLTYENVEGEAEKLLFGELKDARNRA